MRENSTLPGPSKLTYCYGCWKSSGIHGKCTFQTYGQKKKHENRVQNDIFDKGSQKPTCQIHKYPSHPAVYRAQNKLKGFSMHMPTTFCVKFLNIHTDFTNVTGFFVGRGKGAPGALRISWGKWQMCGFGPSEDGSPRRGYSPREGSERLRKLNK